jgi:hypothetical protein
MSSKDLYLYYSMKHLCMKEGGLFCFVVMDASYHVLGVLGKLSARRGAWAWFHDVLTCGAKLF